MMATPTSSSGLQLPGTSGDSRPEIDDDLASVASEIINRSAKYRAMDGGTPGGGGDDSEVEKRVLPYKSSAVEVDDSGDEEIDDLMEGMEDLEPPLKYERLSSDLRQTAISEQVSAVAVHPKLLAVGTSWGVVHIFDALGQSHVDHKLPGHSVGVSQISIDHKGEFLASCSGVDGRVLVTGLCTSQHNIDIVLGRKVNAIALDPLFARSGYGRRFLTGDDRVTMHEKTYFNRYKQTPLGSVNDGPITCIKWRGYFAAWCCRRGVVVLDVTQERIISIIKYDQPQPANVEDESSGQYVTRLAWSDQYTLYVTQGDNVKVCAIKKRVETPEQLRHHDLPEHYVTIKSSFKLKNFWVCGVAPRDGNKHILLMTISKTDKTRPPEMMLVEPHPKSFSLVSIDILPLSGYEEFNPQDYNVEFSLEDKHYFVMCPSDVVMGKPRDIDDNIDWLLDHEDYSKALMLAESNVRSLERHTVIQVGRKYLDVLLEREQFKEGAKLCVRVFKNDKKMWQDEAIVKFAKYGQLKALAPLIPKGNSAQVRLDRKYYETILVTLIADPEDHEVFLDLVKDSWSSDLYDIARITDAVLEVLINDAENQALMRALAALYTYSNRYDKAMEIYLELKHKDVFALIRKRDLFESIHNKIAALMDLDPREAVKLFLEYMERLEPELIVAKLEEAGSSKNLYLYLDALRDKDREESKRYHGKLVSLYADYDQKKLMPFLNSSDYYDMRDALEACMRRGMTRESIFILARMGDTRQALQLIIAELSNIDEAIEFCKEHDDPDLWDDLIEYSIDKPLFIHRLLLNIGTHVDPRVLISRIQPGLQIPALRESLATIVHDYHLQLTLQEGCKRIVVSDCFTLIAKQEEVQKHGVSVCMDGKCGGCGGRIVDPSTARRPKVQSRRISPFFHEPAMNEAGDVVVFMCRHTFHSQCLSNCEDAVCNICEVKN